jgi:hypothetical protein
MSAIENFTGGQGSTTSPQAAPLLSLRFALSE